jgi:universal stress protein E
VERPGPTDGPRQILVCSDLGPAAEVALGLGVALARVTPGACVHVLHAVEFPLDRLWSTGLSDDWTEAYRRQVRAHAEETIREQLTRAGAPPEHGAVRIHIVEGAGVPDEPILEFIQKHDIDLLVLGTVGRSGLSGFLLGNVAERLLPEVYCSVLAVKPPGFHSQAKR